MTGRAGRTGAEPTVLSALEQNIPRDRRILVDALALRVLPWWSRALVRLAKPFMDPLLKAAERSAAPGMWGALLCRKRYIDERLIESAARVDQIVNLGAGLDTRLYRLNAVHSLPAWELDQAANIRQKRRRFSRALHRIPPTIRLVPIDFDHEPVAQVLAGNGYDADYADLADRYIRPTGRALTVSTIEHVVFAEKR